MFKNRTLSHKPIMRLLGDGSLKLGYPSLGGIIADALSCSSARTFLAIKIIFASIE